MNISDDGLALIRGLEGCKLKAYQDGGGKWTIGVGHTGGVKINDVITEADATNFLIADVKKAVDAINYFVEVPLNQNQFNALCSFTFNVGTGSFQTSTLLKVLNNSDYAGAAQQFLRWVYIKSKFDRGLQNRRTAESKLFLTPVESP